MENLIQLYGYLHGMWRYRWSALLIAWLVAVAGWVVVLAIPDKFEAKAVVFIDTDSIMKPLLKGLTVEADTSDQLNVISRVLLSRENLLKVIRETDMDLATRTPEDRDRLVDSLASTILLSGWDQNKHQNNREPKSNIYEISYQSDSAQLAQQVVSKLLNTLIANTLNSSRTDTAEAQKFIENQIADYGQHLTVAEQRLAKFKKTNAGLMPDDTGGYYARLQRAEDALAQTRLALKLAEKRYSELRKQLGGEKPLIDSASYQSASMLTLRQDQAKLESLLTQYTEDYPGVKELRSQIAKIKAGQAANGSPANIAGSGDSSVEFNPVYQNLKLEISKSSVEVETLKTQLSDQVKAVTDLRKSISAVPEVEANLAKLNRDYEVTRKRYLELVGRRDAARLAQDAGKSGNDVTIRIIEPPIVPTLPSAPNRLLLLGGAFVVAIAAGLGWSLFRFLLLPPFIGLKQLRQSIALPVLGSVNLFLTPAHIRRRRLQLTSFLVSVFLLIGVFGGVVWYRDDGTALVGSVFSAGTALVGSVINGSGLNRS